LTGAPICQLNQIAVLRASDAAGGTAHGQGVKAFGADWYVVNAGGSKIDTN